MFLWFAEAMHHRQAEGLTDAPNLPCTTAASPLLEALVVVQLDDLRGRYVQVLVDLAREVLVEQRLELAVLLLQLGDLGRDRAMGRARARARGRGRGRGRGRVGVSEVALDQQARSSGVAWARVRGATAAPAWLGLGLGLGLG